MRMLRYEGRSTVDELLADPYLEEIPDIEYELGIFGLKKFKSKLFNWWIYGLYISIKLLIVIFKDDQTLSSGVIFS